VYFAYHNCTETYHKLYIIIFAGLENMALVLNCINKYWDLKEKSAGFCQSTNMKYLITIEIYLTNESYAYRLKNKLLGSFYNKTYTLQH